MHNEIEQLIRQLNLTRFNVKNMTDFSHIAAVVCGADDSLRRPLLDSIFISAFRSKNMALIDFISTEFEYLPEQSNSITHIFKALDVAFTPKFTSQSTTASLAGRMWDSLEKEQQTEVISLFFMKISELSNTSTANERLSAMISGLHSIMTDNSFNELAGIILEKYTDSYLSYDETITDSFISIMNEEASSPLYDYECLTQASKSCDYGKLKGYEDSVVRYIDKAAKNGNYQLAGKVISESLDSYAESCLSLIEKHKISNFITPSNHKMLVKILHSAWLDNKERNIIDLATSVIKEIHSSAIFKELSEIAPKLKTISGTIASLKTSELMIKGGEYPNYPESRFNEDSNAISSIMSKREDYSEEELGVLSMLAMRLSFLQTFIPAYNSLMESKSLSLEETSDANKIKMMAVVAIFEFKSSIKDSDKKLSNLLRKDLPGSAANVFYPFQEVLKLIGKGISDEQKISIDPKNKEYIKSLIDMEMIDKSNVKHLNAKLKREVLNKDLGV